MKKFEKWAKIFLGAAVVSIALFIYFILCKQWLYAALFCIAAILLSIPFVNLWKDIEQYGVKTEVDISRVLGKEAKDALSFGNIGMITYDDDYVVTWCSPFFAEHGIDIVNKKVTSWIENIRTLFDEEVDEVIGRYQNSIFEITRKEDSRLLYVKDITEFYELQQKYINEDVVVGMMQLDNYLEYQQYENEEIIANINTHLRAPLVSWAKENGMFIRRIRSDRFILILNQEILRKVRAKNFSILQLIRDKSMALNTSITLSMAFAYGTSDYPKLDDMLNELIELCQSRGGDQVAIRCMGESVQYIGGHSEAGSARSKVRARIMAQSIQQAISDSKTIYIAGHVHTDFDCMGAALSISNWATALNKNAYIVLDGVERDQQLQMTMNHYMTTLNERHIFISPSQAQDRINYNEDLLVLVDHATSSLSSCKDFIEQCKRIIVIDHHRRNESFVKNTMLSYVESTASSTCELIVELLQNISNHIPIYEAEATIMYLGIIVDTNRFKMHTDSRTFEACSALRTWGANSQVAEQALKEDYGHFLLKQEMLINAKAYLNMFMIAQTDTMVNQTLASQVSDSLLLVKGCRASFTLVMSEMDPDTVSISARGDGTVNVQRIMEKLSGGGHFSAAAAKIKDCTISQAREQLCKVLKEVYDEGNFA
ncbi:DHH family phosphoesterase [Floccifex sp.]|uniref:DHH family phosphoesterase n=1 Tax=Floccifex sp. TaxID=2815810 RepID=UPI002A74CE47|nr:DHH family phosphoesterase [Floccifex sp.]MDY2958013.1 DHH family phosphoesterase [Floccifex sp.]